MTADVETAALRVQHLTRLTRDLTDRLSLEMDALRAHRAQDLSEGMAQTQEMANLYRRESAQVKANPAAIAAAPENTRVRRFKGTQTLAVGQLTRAEDGRWVLDLPGEDTDAEGFRLDDEQFVVGEYVSLAQPGGDMRAYRVTLAQPLPTA